MQIEVQAGFVDADTRPSGGRVGRGPRGRTPPVGGFPVSHFDLRDISERLGRSADAEAVVFEFLGALQGTHSDWRATLSFYEVSRDALVKVYERDGDRLRSREIVLPVDQLPARMIRGFFHPNAFFEPSGRHSLLSPVVHSSPVYQPDLSDAVLLRLLLPVVTWNSCVCMPLAEREEMLAVLVLVSEKSNAFGPKILEEVIPLKSMAALVLAKHLHRADHHLVRHDDEAVRRAAQDFQERIEQISVHARELEQDLVTKVERVDSLSRQIEDLDRGSLEYRNEMDRVKEELRALEEQRAKASESLSAASQQLALAEARIEGLDRTHKFVVEMFQLLANEHDSRQFPKQLVDWLSERLGVERCSVMLVDRSGYLLRVAFQSGIDPAVVERVRVRIGQGVAGWVALHRKPLLVRARDDAPEVERHSSDEYNTDSFICAPIVYGGRLAGVINLSNKRDRQPFDTSDLDRAVLAAGIFAITLGENEAVRRALAWAA